MNRRKFIFSLIAVLAVPAIPKIKTTYDEYVEWFKNYYGEVPSYTGKGEYAGQLPPYIDRLLESRRGWQNSTPVYHKIYDGKLGYYNQEEWDETRKEELEKFKVITFEEYKRYVA